MDRVEAMIIRLAGKLGISISSLSGISFADTVRLIREKCGLSQNGLSSLTGIPLPTVRDWEHKRREPKAHMQKAILLMLLTYASALKREAQDEEPV